VRTTTTNAAVSAWLDACRRSSRLYFSHFATRTVYNTVDLYAAKPDNRPESRFPVIRTARAKNRRFYVPQPTFFVSLGDASAIITQYVAWMERQFNACQTPRSMYLSVFRVIRCLSQSVSPKIAIFTTFLFPLGRPWGNHAKCCIDGKRIRCLQIVSLHVPI